MSLRHAERLAEERLRVLETQASLQREELSATFEKWEKRKALAWGTRMAGWAFKLCAQPRLRWFIATAVLSRLQKRRAH
ncbi:MAG: hypothetical protein WDO56_13350 [Gammaproteobacteria bacterium]